MLRSDDVSSWNLCERPVADTALRNVAHDTDTPVSDLN